MNHPGSAEVVSVCSRRSDRSVRRCTGRATKVDDWAGGLARFGPDRDGTDGASCRSMSPRVTSTFAAGLVACTLACNASHVATGDASLESGPHAVVDAALALRAERTHYLKQSSTHDGSELGYDVAIDGDTIVVGAPRESGGATGVDGDEAPSDSAEASGAVYVFVRRGATWVQQAYLKASNARRHASFGTSVAISGDTIVVGSPGESSAATGIDGDQGSTAAPWSGAAYVFVRTGGVWTQQAYVKASNTDASDQFGFSVAISGETIVVGAVTEASDATGVDGDQSRNVFAQSGAAYAFGRRGTTWAQEAYLKASNTASDSQFGWSVAIDGDVIVVGSPLESSTAVGVNGDAGVEVAMYSGAAYVFRRGGGHWAQEAYLKASNTHAGDDFGWSVAISGDTIAVGGHNEDGGATGANGDPTRDDVLDSGAVYVFSRDVGVWAQEAYLKASNTGSDDRFGCSIALSGDTLVVGAWREDSAARLVDGDGASDASTDSGAAYAFVRSDEGWSQAAYLKAPNAGDGDAAGWSVAVSGTVIVIGARGEDGSATGVDGTDTDSASQSGAAYTFE